MRNLLSRKNRKGFTLVELIVVIVIIAILAAALVTSLVGYINKAKATSALVEANNVYVAAQAYISEKSSGSTTDKAMIDAINVYLGADVVSGGTTGTGKGVIKTLTLGGNNTITAFSYTASNGSTASFSAGKWNN